MRILIAEDDAALANFVRQGLQAEQYTVDVAAEGEQARAMGTEHEYDLVVLDLNLPRMDGVNVLRHLRLKRPSLPVLILTLRSKVEDRVQCLDTGADDYIPKQLSEASLDILHVRDDLIAKIKAAVQSDAAKQFRIASRKPPRSAETPGRERSFSTPEIVALGTSTGGPKALQDILPSLPADLPVPIIIVQHMPLGFTAPFSRRLDDLCQISIREAAHQDVIKPGVVYIAPAGVQLTVERKNSSILIALSGHAGNQLHVPSVDVMMQSVASVFHANAMGVIMTGMGADGAQGMKAIHCEGGLTIGQDEASSTVYGMPRVCAEMGTLDRVVPLTQIPSEIVQATKYRKASVV